MYHLIYFRKRTIDAHQNRIKELQDKFKQDLDDLQNAKATKANHEVNILHAEITRLCQEIDKLTETNKRDTLDRKLVDRKLEKSEADVRYYKQIISDNELQYKNELDRMARMKQSEVNSDKSDQLKTIKDLQDQLNTMQVKHELCRTELQTKLNDNETKFGTLQSEVEFLKNTVHAECEERMALMKKITILKERIGKEKMPVETTVDNNELWNRLNQVSKKKQQKS